MTQAAPADNIDPDDLALLDEAQLLSFTNGDAALENEITELFINSASGYLKTMEEAIEEQRSWSAEVHALKGASANLGAQRLAALAKRLEFAPPSLDDLKSLLTVFEETQTYLLNRRS